ncbi:ABC transporter [Photobacterium sp. OFAV2-7]|uniref:ABC transporter n=1 Tax=Photobacterium sp. OFAV2-7 TaxID=2917748 RepID=UPI001EF66FBB|nr:ABC transporter [Photobacterium sp. OFAV2-7]MCG7586415.1 ABC transporter [Photobacterium sp. OFAV2-7]
MIEYRIVVKLPLFIALFSVLNFALLMSGDNVSFYIQSSGVGEWVLGSDSNGFASYVGKLNEIISGCVYILLFLVYIPKTLRKERNEGSLMFWRAVPVSDYLAIAAKLLFALVIIPLITSILLIFSDVLVWLLAKMWMPLDIMASFSITVPDMIWHWLGFIGSAILMSLSLLPIACVLLVVSQLVSYPMVAVVVAVIVIKLMSYLLFGTSAIGDFLSDVYSLPLTILTDESPLDAYLSLGLFTHLALWLVSAVLFHICSKQRATDDSVFSTLFSLLNRTK